MLYSRLSSGMLIPMVRWVKLVALAVGPLALNGCGALLVANLVGALLAPDAGGFAPSQAPNSPFAQSRLGEELSPVLNEVAKADVREKCLEELEKMRRPTAREGTEAEAAADKDNAEAETDTGGCQKRWVCLPAQDRPVSTLTCRALPTGNATPTDDIPHSASWSWNAR